VKEVGDQKCMLSDICGYVPVQLADARSYVQLPYGGCSDIDGLRNQIYMFPDP
jgi:hypothetical protein